MREPLNDDELNALLSQWKAPANAPASLERALMTRVRPPWWRWLWTGSVQVPAPVVLALLMVVAALWFGRGNDASRAKPEPVIQAGFDPVTEWKPRIIRSSYASN